MNITATQQQIALRSHTIAIPMGSGSTYVLKELNKIFTEKHTIFGIATRFSSRFNGISTNNRLLVEETVIRNSFLDWTVLRGQKYHDALPMEHVLRHTLIHGMYYTGGVNIKWQESKLIVKGQVFGDYELTFWYTEPENC